MPALCGVCQQNSFRYTCPKCEIVYCSLACYQRHGEKCTENFYQQQVQEELESRKVDGEERKRLEQIVLKLNRLDGDDELDGDEEEKDAEEAEESRIADLMQKAENGELGVEDLTEEEARRFHSELKRGTVSRLLDVWEPWWQRAGVVEVSVPSSDKAQGGGYSKVAVPSSDVAEEPEAEVDPTFTPPPHICCPEGRQPHASVALASLSALYAYVHTMRAFNGEWQWAPLEAAPQLLHLCPAICSHQVHSSAKECLIASLDNAAALPGRLGLDRSAGVEFNILCLADVSAVIRGGADFSARAVCETVGILENCLANGGCGKSGKLKKGVKKLEFLASFVFHHFELFLPLAAAADNFAEKRELVTKQEQELKNAREHDGIVMPDMD